MTTDPADSPTATTNVPSGGAPADTDGRHFTKTTAGQIAEGVLGVIAFLNFARPVIFAGVLGLRGRDDVEAADPLGVLVPHTSRYLVGRRSWSSSPGSGSASSSWAAPGALD